MKLLKLIVYPDAILRQVAKPVDLAQEGVIASLRPFADELVRAMRAYDGVAIAAPQVGASIRVIAIDQNAGSKTGGCVPLVLVNPVITESSAEQLLDDEGCLSFPGATIQVSRAETVSVDYIAMDGEAVEKHVFKGLLARAVAHEIEHLEGRLLIDHIKSQMRRDMVKRKATRAKKLGVRPKRLKELELERP